MFIKSGLDCFDKEPQALARNINTAVYYFWLYFSPIYEAY